MNILIVEDDEKILAFVQKGLKEEGFTVDTAISGDEGLYCTQINSYDLILLDWGLPVMNGLQICKELRLQNIKTPIIMLTAKNEIDDKIESLDSGVDDYITKPFVFRELVARVNSLIRRTSYNHVDIITLDTLEVNIAKRIVKRSGKVIELTTREFTILIYLLNNQNSIVTHSTLQDTIWGMSEVISSNVINVFVHHLRKKIDIQGEIPLIKTVRGSGYKIEANS